MKRAIMLVICLSLFLSQAVLTFAAWAHNSNPFEKYDLQRENSIAEGGSKKSFHAKPQACGTETRGERYVVKFKDSASLTEIYDCVKKYDYKLLSDSEQRMFCVTVENLSEFRNDYGHIIELVEEDERLSLAATVDDPIAEGQWELEALNAYEAWDMATADNEVVVAVLDSGIYRQHEDFEGVSILAGYDAVTDSEGVNFDYNGHGTKVASIITAANNNGVGMASVAFGITLMPIRISDETGFIYSTDFIQALYFAADSGADIINMSFGGYVYSAAEEAAVEYASSKGCILVSAAGNEGANSEYAGMKSYPASYNSVISVGSINAAGEVCQFSQYNDSVDLVAPGASLTVANDDGGYEQENGTSFSAAYASAAIALSLSAMDEGYSFTADQFVALVAELNGNTRTDAYGYGAIDLVNILANINTPLYSGVHNGGVYHRNLPVFYNRGTAKLDGEGFESGDMVLVSGNHELVITDGDNRVTVNFITDNIPLTYEYIEGESSAKILFSRGTATLDGAPYISGTDITTNGKHFFIITGPYGNSESYRFECSFGAPTIFGVENGGYYTSGVYISTTDADTITLNGNPVESGLAVTKNGVYTLTAKNGNAAATVYFTVAIPNVSRYNASVSNGKIAVDEAYNSVYLYNEILSGIRLLDKRNLNNTSSFIRTDDGIISHGFTGTDLILLHTDGVSTVNRELLSEGNADSMRYYEFEGSATDAVIADECVYYISTEENACKLRRINTSNGVDEVLYTLNESYGHIAYDNGTVLLAESDGTVCGYDIGGSLLFKLSTEVAVTELLICGNLFCTGGSVFSISDKDEVFALNSSEKILHMTSEVLVTSSALYSIQASKRIGVFDTPLTDCCITESNRVYKYLSTLALKLLTTLRS